MSRFLQDESPTFQHETSEPHPGPHPKVERKHEGKAALRKRVFHQEGGKVLLSESLFQVEKLISLEKCNNSDCNRLI